MIYKCDTCKREFQKANHLKQHNLDTKHNTKNGFIDYLLKEIKRDVKHDTK